MFDINDKWQSGMIEYNGKKRLEAAFIFGFISLLLCGIGDWFFILLLRNFI